MIDEKKKFIIKINKYNENIEKDKIILISIGKTNLLKNNHKEKKYIKLIYEVNTETEMENKLFGDEFIRNNNKLRIIKITKKRK